MSECVYCGAELAGAQQVCRDCWLAKYSEGKPPTRSPSVEQRVRSFVAAAPVTSSLVAANCLVFILTIAASKSLRPDAAQLLHFGASYLPLTLAGQWWRPVTAIFLHANFEHLFFNMLVLADIGSIIEVGVGRRGLLITYFSSGVASSLSSEVWHSTGTGVGASGAIFGLVGLLIPLLIYRKVTVRAKRRVVSVGTVLAFVAYNLFLGAMTPGIDNAAHLGGLGGGLAIGLVFYRLHPQVVEISGTGTVQHSELASDGTPDSGNCR